MRTLIVWLAALLAVVGSGIQVVQQTHDVRRLHGQLQDAQRMQDAELAKHSRLLIERAALAAYQNVERIAQSELAMRFPLTVERIER